MNRILYKLFFGVYSVCFVFIPMPLFYDFGKMDFFIVEFNDGLSYDSPVIPFPVGGISLLLALFIGYFLSILNPKKMIPVFKPSGLLILFLFYVGGFGLYALVFSGLSSPRFVQLILPTVIFSFITFPSSYSDKIRILKCYVCGVALFSISHSLSIFFNSDDFSSVHPTREFPGYFGLLIYQSLVSYPGVVSLTLFMMVAVLFRQLSRNKLVRSNVFTLMAFMLLISQLYIGLSSGRRAFLVESIAALILIAFSGGIFVFVKTAISKRKLFLYVLFFLAAFSVTLLYLSSGLSSRFLLSLDSGTLDSGRIEILLRAADFFYQNSNILFFGAGGSGAPGMHNFFLDQIYRVGIVGALFSYLVFFFVVRKFYSKNNNFAKFRYARMSFLLIVISCIFVQSMVNASISQPYYLVNVVAVISLTLFVIFHKQCTA